MTADRSPALAGLIELKAVFAPIGLAVKSSEVTVVNKHAFADLAHVRLEWTVSDETGALASGVLAVPPVAAGTSAVVPMPAIPREGQAPVADRPGRACS